MACDVSTSHTVASACAGRKLFPRDVGRFSIPLNIPARDCPFPQSKKLVVWWRGLVEMSCVMEVNGPDSVKAILCVLSRPHECSLCCIAKYCSLESYVPLRQKGRASWWMSRKGLVVRRIGLHSPLSTHAIIYVTNLPRAQKKGAVVSPSGNRTPVCYS